MSWSDSPFQQHRESSQVIDRETEGIGGVGTSSRQNSGRDRIAGGRAHSTSAAVGRLTPSNSVSGQDAVDPQPR